MPALSSGPPPRGGRRPGPSSLPPPHSVIGMASKIINYYRQLPEDKNPNPQSNSEESLTSEGQALSTTINQTKRIPRHLLHLQQNSLSSNTASDAMNIPKLSEGITEVLEANDPFPFLGDIEPGAPPQPCFHTNLFRAPLFTQTAHPTDFLLIRNPSNRKSTHFILRSLPIFFTCGQHEPLMIIPKPGKKKSLNDFQKNFLTLHITRYFLNQGTPSLPPSLTSSPPPLNTHTSFISSLPSRPSPPSPSPFPSPWHTLSILSFSRWHIC
jgi:hypothetical protein